MRRLLLFLLLLMPLASEARIIYVSPSVSSSVSSDPCTSQSPCNWISAYGFAGGGDTIMFLDGVYTTPTGGGGFATTKNGTSDTQRLTLQAVNRRGATIRTASTDGAGDTDAFLIQHNNYVVRGLKIVCKPTSGTWPWDCFNIQGRNRGEPNEVFISNVLVDDVHVTNAGHAFMHCNEAGNIEIKNSTFDSSGENSDRGEGLYLASCCQHDSPCLDLKAHHTIFARFGENATDMKDQAKRIILEYNIYSDQKERRVGSEVTQAGTAGPALFVGNNSSPNSFRGAGNYVRNNMIFRVISNKAFQTEDDIRFDAVSNVLWGFDPIASSDGSGELNGKDETSSGYAPESYNNIHCPSEGVTEGFNLTRGKTANQLNRPTSECTTRINTILGTPGIASCEIGQVANNILVVNLQADVNGPVSSVGAVGNWVVTYDAVNATENSIVLTTGTQARITMAAAPAQGQVVKVDPAVGTIKNSAFIGGRSCGLSIDTFKTDPGGTQLAPNQIANGEGVCGTNHTDTLPVTCTNNVATQAPVETLTQDVWRFYASHAGEGQGALAPENTNIQASLGTKFRWRVGVRGGGNNAASRSYALAVRVCDPTCGQWLEVSADYSATGITYVDDQAGIQGTATTNQLSLGGKTFLAGSFMESTAETPAVAIGTTQQVEWEYSLLIPSGNNPLSAGASLELRMQHNDGTALSAYPSVPSLLLGGSVGERSGGSFAGGVMQ